MNKVTLLIIIVILVSLCFAQTEYTRKSISSVESVWIAPNALSGISSIPQDFLEEMLKFYIEMPRFDYNELPSVLLNDFRNRANQLTNVEPYELAEVLRMTIGESLKEILEDPDIQQARVGDIRDDTWKVTFAGSKGRSMGLTVDEMEQLMNSAYVYLPFINSFSLGFKDGTYEVNIAGGIIWYQLVVHPNGETDFVLRLATTAVGVGYSRVSSEGVRTYSFGAKRYSVSDAEHAIYNAIHAWARNLSIRTKEIDDFNITAQIVERRGGRLYGARVGKREGLHLDDGFFIINAIEAEDGTIQNRRVGFARLVRNADNMDNPDAMSHFKQLMGRSASEGMFLREHPRMGLDWYVRFGYQIGMNVPHELMEFYHPFEGIVTLIEEDIEDQISATLGLSYNLAPLVGVSQLFADLDLYFGYPLVKYHKGIDSPFAFTSGFGLGVSKKWWSGRNAFSLDLKGSMDLLLIIGEIDMGEDEENISIDFATAHYGVSGGLGYQFMITPNMIFNISASYKHSFKSDEVIFKYDGDNVYYEGVSHADRFKDEISKVSLGGIMLNAGFSYSFGQSRINLFGFLDPLKKH
jgi:hypothetical protein